VYMAVLLLVLFFLHMSSRTTGLRWKVSFFYLRMLSFVFVVGDGVETKNKK
jgi:hypothetical protein